MELCAPTGERLRFFNSFRYENVAVGIGSLRLSFAGLPAGKHALYEGDKLIGLATADEWKAGVDLTKWADLSTNKRTAEMWDLIQKKQRILGLAWLTDVGHKRPDTRKGIPLADALKYGEEVDEQVKKLMSSIFEGDPNRGGMIRGAFKDALASFLPRSKE
jgi:hypothetical protein